MNVLLLLFQTDTVDEIATVKFAYVQWVGELVKPMSRGKISTHKGALENHFKVSGAWSGWSLMT